MFFGVNMNAHMGIHRICVNKIYDDYDVLTNNGLEDLEVEQTLT